MRAGPIADQGRGAAGQGMLGLLGRADMGVAFDRAGGDDVVVAGDLLVVLADQHAGVMPGMVCGLPALPMPTMRPSRMPISALMMPVTASMIVAP